MKITDEALLDSSSMFHLRQGSPPCCGFMEAKLADMDTTNKRVIATNVVKTPCIPHTG